MLELEPETNLPTPRRAQEPAVSVVGGGASPGCRGVGARAGGARGMKARSAASPPPSAAPPVPWRQRSRLVAAITSTSTWRQRDPPTGRHLALLERAQQLRLEGPEVSLTSSRKSVPPSATS